MQILTAFTAFAAFIGGLIILATLTSSASAPQEAAGFACALAVAAIPYILMRSLHISKSVITQEAILKELQRINNRLS